MKSVTDFSKARVGDLIWTIQDGDVLICQIDSNPSEEYPIITSKGNAYNNEGYFLETDKFPSAFWSNPHVVIPDPPKRKVKKVLHGWVKISEKDIWSTRFGCIYRSKEDLLYCEECEESEIVEINQEYEVEK